MNNEIFQVPNCIYCGICNPACPFFYVQRKEHLSPRAWTYSLIHHSHDLQSLLQLSQNCFFCFRCFEACPLNINYPAALLYNLFKLIVQKEITWKYTQIHDTVYLECQLPDSLQLGYQPYPMQLEKEIKVQNPSDLFEIFQGKQLYMNTYFFQLAEAVTKYYHLDFPLKNIPEYWNLSQLLTRDELFSVLPVIPEFLPSSIVQIKLPQTSELIKIPSLAERLQKAH